MTVREWSKRAPFFPARFVPEKGELANFVLFVYRPHNFLSVYDDFLADVRLPDQLKDKYKYNLSFPIELCIT
jgi:hypothetical protein